MLKRLLLALALILPGTASHALDIAVVVTACGTPPTTYVAGQSFAITQDTTGTLCSSGSGGGGGGASAKATAADPTYVEGTLNPLSLNLSGYQRVILPTSQLLQNSNLTVTDCSGTVATGGTAVNAIAAQTTLHGFTLMNIDTTEGLWMSLTGTATASTGGSYFLQAATASAQGGSFTTPFGLGTAHAVSVVAATNGHKFSCTWW
jgi:hypothetical protein